MIEDMVNTSLESSICMTNRPYLLPYIPQHQIYFHGWDRHVVQTAVCDMGFNSISNNAVWIMHPIRDILSVSILPSHPHFSKECVL